jgi:hypothetical protein
MTTPVVTIISFGREEVAASLPHAQVLPRVFESRTPIAPRRAV